jgi:uncharacterized SAM-binding protein YcdF (DUF218 family)
MTRRVLFAAVVVAAVAGGLWMQRERILTAIGRFVVSTEAPVAADAVVVLAGSLPDRILEAVDLYKEGWAPRIVLTKETGMPGIEVLQRRGVKIPEKHELNISIAEQLGVPRAAIVVLDGPANSTISEADIVLAWLRSSGARRALIVTSKMHSHRAGLIYRARAGSGLEIVSCASRHDPYDPGSWWRSRGYVRRLVFEYQKLVIYWLRDRWLGPEAHRVKAGGAARQAVADSVAAQDERAAAAGAG